MNRRRFLQTALAAPLPLVTHAAETRAAGNIRITGVEVIVTTPEQAPMGNYVLVNPKADMER